MNNFKRFRVQCRLDIACIIHYTLTEHFIRNTRLILGWATLCLKTASNLLGKDSA